MRTLPNIVDPHDNFQFERKLRSRGFVCVAGVDEVGRGPLAGPVVAACVSLPEQCDPSPFLDSKKTSHRQRLELAALLEKCGASIGFGIVSHKLIDTINILQSSLLAMKLAVYHHSVIACTPDFLLVDGKFDVPLQISQQHLTEGESKSGSIAAASIVAKLRRDAIMDILHTKYPQYGFNTNKGYPTRFHRQAIAESGICPAHRLTFKGAG